ncbi:Hypothetical predicted protein, partial [Pelobates cultripes]
GFPRAELQAKLQPEYFPGNPAGPRNNNRQHQRQQLGKRHHQRPVQYTHVPQRYFQGTYPNSRVRHQAPTN